MFFRLLLESFLRQRRRKALAGVAILLGTTAVTAMLALATTIGDRIHRELAVYGANIIVTPAASALEVKVNGVNVTPANGGTYLHEADLDKLKTIFWANNITGVSPQTEIGGMMIPLRSEDTNRSGPKAVWPAGDSRLIGLPPAIPVKGVGYWFNHRFGDMVTGAPQLHPWWKLQGRWPSEQLLPHPKHGEIAEEIVLGATLAKQSGLHVGDWISVGKVFAGEIVGIVSTGDETEHQLLYPLDAYPRPYPDTVASPNPGEYPISRVEISAHTKPEDAFARKDPDTLTPKLREIWYCRPYANSIAYQIREAIPGAQAEQVRQVEQSEGTILDKIGGLMWLVSGAALLAAGFAVSAAMATAVLERRGEIGLMRSLGAGKGRVAMLFYAEAGLLALAAGTLGYLAGSGLAAWLGTRIFDTPGSTPAAHSPIFNPVLLPVVVGLGLLVALAGSTPSIRAALRMSPSAILREDG